MSNTAQKIGWIGVGRMGTPMAERLLKAGHDVTIWNRTRAKAEPLTAKGGKVVDKPVDLDRGRPHGHADGGAPAQGRPRRDDLEPHPRQGRAAHRQGWQGGRQAGRSGSGSAAWARRWRSACSRPATT